jgi:hypothetical protein
MKPSWIELLENKTYETLQGLPWLFENSLAHKIQWQAKLNYYYSLLDRKIITLNSEMNKSSNEKTKNRLSQLLAGLENQRQLVAQILPELKAYPDSLSEAVKDRVPSAQFVGKYINNIFRDWAWGEQEIEAALNAWLPLFPKSAKDLKIIFLGAGACRLPYEIHRRLMPALSIATDINPLLLIAADKIIKGETVELIEFPHPVEKIQNVAVKHKLKSSIEPQENFQLVFADAINSPFKEKSFDTVATPWLVDILPISFQEISIRINNSLKDGGLWVNSGPLSYADYEKKDSITAEEVEFHLSENGFTLEKLTTTRLPYMHSPYSLQRREEIIINFRAKKKSHCKRPKRFSLLPDYITDTKKPIVASDEMKKIFSMAEGDLQLLSLIDNTKSIDDLASLISKQTNVNQQEIVESLTTYFVTLFERSKTN